MNTEFLPEPQHEQGFSSLLAFLLSHPPTPLAELTPPGAEAPARRIPISHPKQYVLKETLVRYSRIFRELPPPITATHIAAHLSFQATSVLRTLRALQSLGYVRPAGWWKVHGVRPAMTWEWTALEAPSGARNSPAKK